MIERKELEKQLLAEGIVPIRVRLRSRRQNEQRLDR